MAEVAKLMGMELMPWQREVANLALEINPSNGKLAYREVNLTVPRQSGKTTLLLALMVHRAHGFGMPQTILYTAQNRIAARGKWRDEHLKTLDNSPLADQYDVRLQLGDEMIQWHNGSMHGLSAPTEKASHGKTLDLGVIDEAFAREDHRVEQAMRPAMITRPQPQLWVVSTAGTEKSLYLRGKVEAGRRRAEAGIRTGVAYVEWSATKDQDPGDPKTWRSCMPALGITIEEESIQADYEAMDLTEFRRAYLNQWADDVPQGWNVIPYSTWMALNDDTSTPGDDFAFAVDVNPGRTAASIGVAGRNADGNLHVEVAVHQRGVDWVVPWLRDRVARHQPLGVVVDPVGPAGSILADLEGAGIDVTLVNVRDLTAACGQFYDAIMEGRLRHLKSDLLEIALGAALRRDLGDGAWAWTRKHTQADISPLVAVTLAAWGYTTKAQNAKGDVGVWVF